MKGFFTIRKVVLVMLGLVIFASCGTPKSTTGKTYKSSVQTPKRQAVTTKTPSSGIYKKNVIAVYYHDKFNGRKTASGAIFDNNKQTAAHKELPFGTQVKVINKANGKWVYVTINDRGPFGKGREIDLTKKAWMSITDDPKKGLLEVDIEIVKN